MASSPLELTLELSARERFELVELRSRFSSEHAESLASYPRCLYWSAHTTAGFLDRSLVASLGPQRIGTYIATLRQLGYHGLFTLHSEYMDRNSWKQLTVDECLQQTADDLHYVQKIMHA